MNTDEYFMQKALEEAQLAFEEDEIPVGAIITIDNRIIAKAHNLTERLNDVTAHKPLLWQLTIWEVNTSQVALCTSR